MYQMQTFVIQAVDVPVARKNLFSPYLPLEIGALILSYGAVGYRGSFHNKSGFAVLNFTPQVEL
jgi:hypothetical protein